MRAGRREENKLYMFCTFIVQRIPFSLLICVIHFCILDPYFSPHNNKECSVIMFCTNKTQQGSLTKFGTSHFGNFPDLRVDIGEKRVFIFKYPSIEKLKLGSFCFRVDDLNVVNNESSSDKVVASQLSKIKLKAERQR